MRLALVLLLAACGGSSKPATPPVVEHEVVPDDDDDDAPEVRASCEPPPGRLRGCVIDETGAGLPGVTLVLADAAAMTDHVTLSDDHGGYAFDADGTDFQLTVYFGDFSSALPVQVTAGKLQPDIVLETSSW